MIITNIIALVGLQHWFMCKGILSQVLWFMLSYLVSRGRKNDCKFKASLDKTSSRSCHKNKKGWRWRVFAWYAQGPDLCSIPDARKNKK
jgi:hypothetical protein